MKHYIINIVPKWQYSFSLLSIITSPNWSGVSSLWSLDWIHPAKRSCLSWDGPAVQNCTELLLPSMAPSSFLILALSLLQGGWLSAVGVKCKCLELLAGCGDLQATHSKRSGCKLWVMGQRLPISILHSH